MEVIVFNSTISDGGYEVFEKMLESPRLYATVGVNLEFTAMKFMDIHGRHDFYFGKERISFSYIGLLFRKGNLIKDTFNIHMMRLWEVGISSFIMRKNEKKHETYSRRYARESNRLGEPLPSGKIKLIQVSGAFTILLFGSIVATLSLIYELLWANVKIV